MIKFTHSILNTDMATAARLTRVMLSKRLLLLPRNLITTATLIRPLSLSSARLVDRKLFDEFTRRKSEFRVAFMSDQRVRERTMLDLPFFFLLANAIWLFWWLATGWNF